MNPHDLTAFFEFVDANHAKHPEGDPMRVGVPGGWEHKVYAWTKALPRDSLMPGVERCCFPNSAELIDHQAACHCMSEWLVRQDSSARRHRPSGQWFLATSVLCEGKVFGRCSKLDCPDDPLAARLAAAKEITG